MACEGVSWPQRARDTASRARGSVVIACAKTRRSLEKRHAKICIVSQIHSGGGASEITRRLSGARKKERERDAMTTVKIAKSAANDVTDNTLRQAPKRLLDFLSALGSHSDLSTLLTPLGWSSERAAEGWALINDLGAAAKPTRSADGGKETAAIAKAVAACEEYQATGLICGRSMLQMTLPEQASYLFDGLEAGDGAIAVYNVGLVLDRCAELEKGTHRKATRKADHEALDLLALSGTTKETRKTLRRQVDEVQSKTATPRTLEEIEADRAADERRTDTLRKIYGWLTMWSEMARTVVKRRDQQIRLGIGRRKSRKKAVVVPVVVPPVVPAPVVAPSVIAEEPAPNSRAA
jgi:hypothetical protein